MRDDSMLVTGLSSAASRREAERRKKELKEKQSKGAKIKPHAQLIIDWIDKEKKDVVNIEKLVLDVTNAENLQAQIIAIQMHMNFLDSIKQKTIALLRAEEKL